MSNFLLMILRFISSVVRDSSSSSLFLNEDLSKIPQWGYKWKILMILMLQNKPKRLFSHAKNPSNHKEIYFNNMHAVKQKKHLGLYLDAKLSFFEHINEKIKKAVKGISVIKELNVTLPLFRTNNL